MPQPWLPEDSLLVGRLMAFRLAENSGAELVRHALGQKLSPGDALRLTGAYPDGAPAVLDGFPVAAPAAAATPAATPAPPTVGTPTQLP